MSLFSVISQLEQPLLSYSKFFSFNDLQDTDSASFAWLFGPAVTSYQTLPKNSSKASDLVILDDELQEATSHRFNKLDPISQSIEMIVEHDNSDTKAKTIVVKYSLVDLRLALLLPKMRCL